MHGMEGSSAGNKDSKKQGKTMDGRRWKGRGWEKKGGKEVEGTPYVSLNFYHNSL